MYKQKFVSETLTKCDANGLDTYLHTCFKWSTCGRYQLGNFGYYSDYSRTYDTFY